MRLAMRDRQTLPFGQPSLFAFDLPRPAAPRLMSLKLGALRRGKLGHTTLIWFIGESRKNAIQSSVSKLRASCSPAELL
jgi:hypothetical protein